MAFNKGYVKEKMEGFRRFTPLLRELVVRDIKVIREREKVLWDIDLFDEGGVGYDRVERGRRRFRIERKDERARKIIDREIRDILLAWRSCRTP